MNRSDIIYSLSDDIYFNPEKSFPSEVLETLQPYQVFTGVGIVATIENDRFERKKLYFKNPKQAKRLHQRKTALQVIQVEECFYAYVVKQDE